MNDRNKQLNAAGDLDRARRMIQVADLAFGAECYEDAASSAYYAAHHAARALLFSLGIEVRSHQALRTLLARHFERPGLVPQGTAKQLGAAFQARMQATYGVGVRFTRDQAAAWVAWSRSFLEHAADHLADFLAAPTPKGPPSAARERAPRYRGTTPSRAASSPNRTPTTTAPARTRLRPSAPAARSRPAPSPSRRQTRGKR